MIVTITSAAQDEFNRLPRAMKGRVAAVFQRLEKWPAVSGAKPLRGDLKGNFRVRTGDYRIIFRLDGNTVIIWRVDNRRDVYE